MMRFSLIMCTIGRIKEVEEFIKHLDCQTHPDFELIIVDQNDDDRLTPILRPYEEKFPILHLRSKKGLSRARNVGLKHVTGDIVAFPDDDCWYPPDLLEKVATFFEEHPGIDGLTGRAVNIDGTPSSGRWDLDSGIIDRFNVWTRGISFSIFLRSYIIEDIGDFDEMLGVGSQTPWGSGEETDYLLRILKKGYKLYYYPMLTVYHPQPIQYYDHKAMHRARLYAQGMGRVLRKHSYPFWFVAYYWLRSWAGVLLSLIKGDIHKAKYYWVTLKGRIWGWLNYKSLEM